MRLTAVKKLANNIPNLFIKRTEMLMDGYKENATGKGTTIGIPERFDGILPAVSFLAHLF